MSESTDKPLPDEQLDEYLKGDSSVSRHYRQLRSTDVPAELDRLVLRQAEEAVKQRPSKSRTWMRWSGPLAIAASAVLVLSIVIETGVQKEAMVTTVSAPASAPAPVMQKKSIERAEQDAVANVASEELGVTEAEQQSAGTVADHELRMELPRERRAVSPPADISPVAPPASMEIAPAAPKLEMPTPEVARQLEPAVETAQAIAQSQPPPLAAPTEPAEVAAKRRSIADVSEHSSADKALEDVILSGTRVQREQSRLAGPRNSVPPASASASGYAGDAGAEEPEQREYSDPEAWLKDIRELRKQNKQEAADREWRRFRAAFPNHVVADTDVAREVKK